MTSPTKPNQHTAGQPKIMAEYDEAKRYFRRICARLRTMGVKTVQIEYNGYGDSGAVESIIATKDNGETVTLPDKLSDRLRDAADTLLPSGFENNEGSNGEFVLDVEKRTLLREHNWRIESTEYEEEELKL